MIRVLIVEDDPMVAEMNRFYLEQVEGFKWQGWARSADEAMEMLLENGPYELILLDVYMKETNGLELLSAIRHRELGVDVVVISAASDKESIRHALQNGAVDYLIKPFEFNRFRAALTAYRERHKVFRQQDSLDQSELDKLSRFRWEQGPSQELSKGFTRRTLQTVWRAVESCQAETFSTEDIATATGISRVSVGKYLAELAEMGALICELNYGALGRPVQRYRVSPHGGSVISKFI
ncbi:response regulator [Paenibacillus donghaensis]|uniref:Transcriptional regulatory protein n=1 Tax=Paenibacillus donghaensis TaxID=414771 RepID=A0A2Z2KCV4_9BACL|nr:response regulator [Paenibacillus donghaensis]ASA20830.1 two-component system response regulator DcuR [Paenibacillus donghaensis]